MLTVSAYVPDLMDRSKVAAVVQHVVFASSPAELVDADLVVVDLSRPGALEAVRGRKAARRASGAHKGRTIGYAHHTQRDLMAEAREAGCDVVLTRADFFSQLDGLLKP